MTAQSRVTADRPNDAFSLDELQPAFTDLEAPRLYEEAIRRKEGLIARSGALIVETAPHTGRSPTDKFIVRDALTDETVWWDNNQPMTSEQFARLYADMTAHARGWIFSRRTCAPAPIRSDASTFVSIANMPGTRFLSAICSSAPLSRARARRRRI